VVVAAARQQGSRAAAGSVAAGRRRQHGGGGGGSAPAASSLAAWWQLGGSKASLVAAPRREAQQQRGGGGGGGSGGRGSGSSQAARQQWRRQAAHWQRDSGGHGCGSHPHRWLPPCATMVARKTPAATAMAGEQTLINYQLKAASAIATETAMMTATMMTRETKGRAAAAVGAEARWQRGGVGSLARAWHLW
jgi:hypothetical protein